MSDQPSQPKPSPLKKVVFWFLGIVFFPVAVPIVLVRLFWKKTKLPEWQKTLVSIGIVLAWFVILPKLFSGSDTNQSAKNQVAATSTSTQAVASSTVPVVSDAQRKREEVKANLTKIAEDMKKFPAEADAWRKEGKDNVGTAELLMLKGWATAIVMGQTYSDKEIKALADAAAKQLSQLQIREFPLMRKKYAETMAEKMWEHDMNVRVYGVGNKTIELVAAVFAANTNIKQIHQTISSGLEELRFTQANYKWYSGDDEYTYFEMEVPKDGDLVPLK